MSSARTIVPSSSPVPADQGRPFGRFRLTRLLGRSSRSMAWLATDPQEAGDCVLMLPRTPAASADALASPLARLKRAAKAQHPQILTPREVGAHERWTFQVYRWPPGALTLAEYLTTRKPPPPVDATTWAIDLLEALAYAHEAGWAHGDLGVHSLLIDGNGRLKLWGMGAVAPLQVTATVVHTGTGPADLQSRPNANGHADTLCVGLLLHSWLAHASVLDEADLPTLCGRIERDIIRLPYSLPQPVPEALRAITNRATDRHEQRRYVSARSFLRALNGWQQSQADGRGGALALLSDRIRRFGHLPSRPGLAQRVSSVMRMENRRIDVLADVMLQDPALSLELLRVANSAQVNVPGRANSMTTVRRAIQLIGTGGLRRAAGGLKAWPGPLSAAHAEALDRGVKRACLAGLLAADLAPAGLDAESALLAAQLQHLGWLLALYHFPEEAEQIELLVQVPPPVPGELHPAGMPEDAAAMAVLGVDLRAIAAALARHWRMEDAVQTVMRPLTRERSVHTPHEVPEWLRTTASCANETLAALSLPLQMQGKALALVAQRYVKVFGFTVDDLRQSAAKAQQFLDEAEAPKDAKQPQAATAASAATKIMAAEAVAR